MHAIAQCALGAIPEQSAPSFGVTKHSIGDADVKTKNEKSLYIVYVRNFYSYWRKGW